MPSVVAFAIAAALRARWSRACCARSASSSGARERTPVDRPRADLRPGRRARARRARASATAPQQVEFAQAVLEAIERAGVLIAEAGTGTGKTFAYLVPALLAGGQVIVSTGTKTLQDQLFHRDLPRVRAALGVPVDTALLKGRANYVCLHHLEVAAQAGHASRAREEVAHIAQDPQLRRAHDERRQGRVRRRARDLGAPGRRPPPRARTASARRASTTRTAS